MQGNSKGETNGGLDSLFKHIDDNPRKWASVSKAADDIIKEKDTMIEKLVLSYGSYLLWMLNMHVYAAVRPTNDKDGSVFAHPNQLLCFKLFQNFKKCILCKNPLARQLWKSDLIHHISMTFFAIFSILIWNDYFHADFFFSLETSTAGFDEFHIYPRFFFTVHMRVMEKIYLSKAAFYVFCQKVKHVQKSSFDLHV